MTTSRSFKPPEALPLAEQQGATFTVLVELMQRLLAPEGCPWDREQTFASLRRYVLEEACEVMDAIDGGDARKIADELGDLLLQVVFLSELGRAEGSFGPDDVVRNICEKLVRRHPHVFEDATADDAEAVERQWETIKASEHASPRGLLERVPRSLPPLENARRLSDRAARVGFDWPNASGSRAKVAEELGELDEAIGSGDRSSIESELGDVLFALVNLARKLELDPSQALHRTCAKFRNRFEHVETQVERRLGGWPKDSRGKPKVGVPLERLETYWEEAKARSREDES